MPVNMVGFESDTYTLQQAGWSLSAWEDPMRDCMQLAIKHDAMGVRGISEMITYHYQREWANYPNCRFPPIRFNMMGKEIRYHIQGSLDWNFKPIDAMPQIVNSEIKTLDDLCHFAPSLARTKQIIVPEENVEDLLERILKLQQPDREAEFLRQAQDAAAGLATAAPRQTFHAQILSFKKAA